MCVRVCACACVCVIFAKNKTDQSRVQFILKIGILENESLGTVFTRASTTTHPPAPLPIGLLGRERVVDGAGATIPVNDTDMAIVFLVGYAW